MGDSETASGFIERIHAARKRARNIQILMALVIVGVFGYFSWQIYQSFANFDDQAYMRVLDKRAAKDVWPAVVAELDRVVTAATPALADNFAKQLEADWPKIGAAIDEETEALGKKLRAHPDKVVTAFSKALAGPVDTALKSAFPDLDEDARKRLVDRVQHRLAAWANSRLSEGVEMHIQAMLDIKKTLDAFKPSTDGKHVPATADEFLVVLLEVIDVRLAGPPEGEVAPPKKTAPKGG